MRGIEGIALILINKALQSHIVDQLNFINNFMLVVFLIPDFQDSRVAIEVYWQDGSLVIAFANPEHLLQKFYVVKLQTEQLPQMRERSDFLRLLLQHRALDFWNQYDHWVFQRVVAYLIFLRNWVPLNDFQMIILERVILEHQHLVCVNALNEGLELHVVHDELDLLALLDVQPLLSVCDRGKRVLHCENRLVALVIKNVLENHCPFCELKFQELVLFLRHF